MSSTSQGFRFAVYGGQFGSEGKGCAAEYLIQQYRSKDRLVVLGENAPNSGHNNSLGKTRSLPVSAYYADVVLLGPDSAIDPALLTAEIAAIRKVRPNLKVYVHENAALINSSDILSESNGTLIARVASTASGGGSARTNKAYHRDPTLTVWSLGDRAADFHIVSRSRWFDLLGAYEHDDWLFEGSQGMMLDMNLGYYPYVTSRSTHPRVSIERNGFGPSTEWCLIGVHRAHPIRTGGHSGPTGGRELAWDEVGVPAEIAAVTKRIRRVFEFSGADFLYSVNLVRPKAIMFTHVDYLPAAHRGDFGFREWLGAAVGLGPTLALHPNLRDVVLFTSCAPGQFHNYGRFLTTRNSVREDTDYNPLLVAL